MRLADCATDELASLAASVRQDGAKDVEAFAAADGSKGLLIFNGNTRSDRGLCAVSVSELFGGGRTGAKGGPYLFKVGLWVPSSSRDELVDWYKSEHLPILMECATWGGCRFVEVPAADGHQFFALHQLDDTAALESEERKRSRATPWFNRLKQHDWFDEAFTRDLYIRTEA